MRDSLVYDPEVNALRISLFDAKAVESEEVLPDVILDYTEDGKVISIEVLNASILKSSRTLKSLYTVRRRW